MNNKYVSQLTKKDIEKILKSCDYKLIQAFTNNNGDTIKPIQKSKKSETILIRCIAPKEEDELLKTMYGLVLNSNSNLAKTLLNTSAILAQNTPKQNAELLLIKDFEAWFPMDFINDNNDYSRTSKIQHAYITYCAEKFGKEYIDDYVAFRKKVLENEETNKL